MGYYIRVERNVKVYVEDLNPKAKQTIVFLHGWPANLNLFEYQYNQLACQFRCIGIDTRGFGKSDKPIHGYGYDRLADDVRCVIDALGLRGVTLAGHSTGGAIAVRYMARHRGFGVARLALCAAAAPSLIQRPGFPYGLPREEVVTIIRHTCTDRPAMLRDFGNIFFFQPVSAAFSDWFFQLGTVASGWATAAIANTWLRETLFADLKAIRVPTLILHGVHDQVVPFPLGQAQSRLLPLARLVPFENSGHGLFYDEVDRFNWELAQFAAG